MKLNNLTPVAGSRKVGKRKGRGPGSGNGTTAGRGTKGHNSRSGGGVRPGFEGGQMPIHRRLPKRGFTNIFKKEYALINIRDLSRFEPGNPIDEAALIKEGLIKGQYTGVKLLGQGEIDKPFVVKVNKASKAALTKVEAAGGKVEVV
ncbi:MAG: 50S ribosomal protein L15 [Deltaproteobacteria bacterium]|nr:50S ribosomal protein L15 [Deltaproteobacteria bacterium]